MSQNRDTDPMDVSGHFAGYADFFSDDNISKDPIVLDDGTSVLFPSGWTDEDADKWRKGHLLQRPADFFEPSPRYH